MQFRTSINRKSSFSKLYTGNQFSIGTGGPHQVSPFPSTYMTIINIFNFSIFLWLGFGSGESGLILTHSLANIPGCDTVTILFHSLTVSLCYIVA